MYAVIDNYDSFTFNIVQYLIELTDKEIKVFRNDEISVSQLEKLAPDGIIIGPGPGRPEEAGISVEVIQKLGKKFPVLGVCLGHQAIGYAFGAPIIQAKEIVHGKVQPITHDGKGVFRGLPSPSHFTRYHSLVIDPKHVPNELEVSAQSTDGEIMAVRHRTYPIEGVQFHPESVASENGKKLLANFLRYRREAFPFRSFLNKLLDQQDLLHAEAESLMDEITEGELTAAQLAGILVALSAKGPAPEEIAGFVSVLRQKQRPFPYQGSVLDTCGTGGDELGTFNVSSMTALVCAACGVPTAKHGNRAVSSKSGSAEFYQALGINIELEPSEAKELLAKTNFAFLFAPKYHSAMRHAAQVRKELGVKTIMNLLGPLANPARASWQIIGVFSDELAPVLAKAAQLLGVKRVITVHATDGQDEISVCGPTNLYLKLDSGEVQRRTITPQELGLAQHELADMVGGSPVENAQLARELLEGRGRPALKDAVLANSGAALWVAQKVSSLQEGVEVARQALESGAVKAKLDEVIATITQLKEGR